MSNDRQVQETVAQCVSCMVFYVNSEKTRHVKAAMTAEAQVIARRVAQWKDGGPAVADGILRSVKSEMVARYGAVEGHKLSEAFTEAFNGAGGPGPLPSHVSA